MTISIERLAALLQEAATVVCGRDGFQYPASHVLIQEVAPELAEWLLPRLAVEAGAPIDDDQPKGPYA